MNLWIHLYCFKLPLVLISVISLYLSSFPERRLCRLLPVGQVLIEEPIHTTCAKNASKRSAGRRSCEIPEPNLRPWHKVLPLPLLPMTMAGPFLTPKQHEEGSFIGCHGYPVCDTMATTTCFLWFCQEMNERSLHLQRDTSQQGTTHFRASESLLNDRCFTLGHSQSKPLLQEIWSLVRKGSIPLKERFQILRCLKCLKRGSEFQQ